MKFTSALLFSFLLLLTSCADNSSAGRNKKIGDRTLEDTEHHIKDSPDILKHDSTILYTGWYYVVDSSDGYNWQLDQSDRIYYLDPKPILTAKNFTTLEIYESTFEGKNVLGLIMRLDKEGTESWSKATLRAQGNALAFILNNQLLQVEVVNSQITGGVTLINRGIYSRQEFENFKKIIENEK